MLKRLTALLNEAPPSVQKIEPKHNRRVHCSSMVVTPLVHGLCNSDLRYSEI